MNAGVKKWRGARQHSLQCVLFYVLLLLFGVGFTCLYHWEKHHAIGMNGSPSATPGFYYLSPLPMLLQTHQQVAFYPSHAAWLTGRHYWPPHAQLIKTIAAVPGQYLWNTHQQIWVCDQPTRTADCRALGRCLPVDRQGRAVPCMPWQGDKIPPDQYYLASQRVPDAVDSRYLGLVKRAQLRYRARLLWAF